jgi:hypothetical protein
MVDLSTAAASGDDLPASDYTPITPSWVWHCPLICGSLNVLSEGAGQYGGALRTALSESPCRSESIDKPRPDWAHLTRSG